MEILDEWTRVLITGTKIVQLQTDGEVLAVVQVARPVDAQNALVLKDGWMQRFSAEPNKTVSVWFVQRANTSRADLTIADWADLAPLPVATPETPARGAFVVAPNNTADLPYPVRQLTLPNGGTVVYDWAGVTWTTGTLLPGTYPMFASRIRVTGTTATGMTGWV